MRKDIIDITGQRFGRLVVLSHGESMNNKRRFWCRCDCGNTTLVRSQHLRNGHTLSCGCLRDEMTALAHSVRIIHGHARKHGKSAEYQCWKGMKGRCLNPKDKQFPNYGGRGITICERWMSFENFLADMGPKPEVELSIDRKDNNGNYEPNNCHWATTLQQSNNQRTNRNLTWQGRTQTISAWARELGLNLRCFQNRIDRGWPLERAFTEPAHTH